MEILYSLRQKYKCYFIKGNKEEYWINYEANGEKGWNEFDSTTGSLYYTYHNLKPGDLEFFKSLPYKKELELEGLLPITICHGSPQKVNEKLLKTGEISHGTVLARAMAICEEKYGTCSWSDVPEECWKMAVDELYLSFRKMYFKNENNVPKYQSADFLKL